MPRTMLAAGTLITSMILCSGALGAANVGGARGVATPSPATPTATATPVCGDGVTVSPETCDPPGAAQPPTGALCRTDCTFCGDQITQVGSGESCDDGNAISGCRVDKPQKPLDGCLNGCQRPICDDPARIQLWDESATGKRDVVRIHARLVVDTAIDFANEPFTLTISRRLCSNDGSRTCSSDGDCVGAGAVCTDRGCAHDAAVLCGDDAICGMLAPGSTCSVASTLSTVFSTTVAGGIPLGKPARWHLRDPLAKSQGGISDLKIQSKLSPSRCAGGANDGQKCVPGGASCPDGACVGYYLLTLTAYGDAERAVADMQTDIVVGTQRWTLRGLWAQFPHAWKLGKKSPVLEPWR